MMGKPVIASTRITVELILDKLAAGESIEQIIEEHPRLTEENIRAALAFASDALRADVVYFKELRRVSKYFLYCSLFAKQQEIVMGIGEGATQKNLNTNYIGRQLVLLPKEQGLLANFTEAVEPLFDQIFTLAQANISLSKARALLLPRLMNW